MKLVATVKLQKARSRAESGKPYMREMHAAIRFILAHSENHTHPFLKEKIEIGLIPYCQSMLLARYLRGDLDGYPPFIWR